MPTTRHYQPQDQPRGPLGPNAGALARYIDTGSLRAALCPSLADEIADEMAYRELAEAMDCDEAIDNDPAGR